MAHAVLVNGADCGIDLLINNPGMLQLLDAVTPTQSGHFLDWQARVLPW